MRRNKYLIWMLALLLALSVSAAACGKTGGGEADGPNAEPEVGTETEPGETGGEAEPEEEGWEQLADPEPEEELEESRIPVVHKTAQGGIALSIPKDWGYQVAEQGEKEFSVSVHPLSEEEGSIRIAYTESFGVCGTELEEQVCTINGMEAIKGIYDNSDTWTFLSFQGDYRGYVVENRAGDLWPEAYESQIEELLATLSLGTDVKDETAVQKLEAGRPLDVDGTGNQLCLSLRDVDGNGGGSVWLSYGDSEVEVTEYVEWLLDSYAVKVDEEHWYVMVGAGYSNDYGNTYLVKLQKGKGLMVCDFLDATTDGTVTANYMEMNSKIDVFGSYTGIRHYAILEDRFYTEEQRYEFKDMEPEGERRNLVLKKDLSADVYGEKVELQKGTKIFPTGCDIENQRFYAAFEKEGEMQEGSFAYELHEEQFGYVVDGTDEYELFEELPYAG